MNSTYWIVESVEDKRFPYRISIVQGRKTLLCLRTQDSWPGTKGQIFCLQEEGRDWPKPLAEIERIPVISLGRYGKRLAVVLDRSKHKRCDFLFVKKKYKNQPGEYEQIFFRTQQSLRERRPRVKLTLQGSSKLHILIDSGEKYAWRFSGCNIEIAKLPAGDYALADTYGYLAVVERKTFNNLVAEFGKLSTFHQVLNELESYAHSALVVEAAYADFLKPDRQKFYAPSFAAKAIAELQAMHPKLSIVFAGNRKLANEWTLKFFAAVKSHQEDVPQPAVSEAIAQYKTKASIKGGSYFTALKILTYEMPKDFTIAQLREACPNISETTLRKVLNDLRADGKIASFGNGKKSYWEKVG